MVLLLLLYYIGQEDHMGRVTVKTVPVLREDDAVIFPHVLLRFFWKGKGQDLFRFLQRVKGFKDSVKFVIRDTASIICTADYNLRVFFVGG